MPSYVYVCAFFAGTFLANATPHFVKGICGEPFPTLFAKPPGRGLSSPLVNVLWGLLNLIIGLSLFYCGKLHHHPRYLTLGLSGETGTRTGCPLLHSKRDQEPRLQPLPIAPDEPVSRETSTVGALMRSENVYLSRQCLYGFSRASLRAMEDAQAMELIFDAEGVTTQ